MLNLTLIEIKGNTKNENLDGHQKLSRKQLEDLLTTPIFLSRSKKPVPSPAKVVLSPKNLYHYQKISPRL